MQNCPDFDAFVHALYEARTCIRVTMSIRRIMKYRKRMALSFTTTTFVLAICCRDEHLTTHALNCNVKMPFCLTIASLWLWKNHFQQCSVLFKKPDKRCSRGRRVQTKAEWLFIGVCPGIWEWTGRKNTLTYSAFVCTRLPQRLLIPPHCAVPVRCCSRVAPLSSRGWQQTTNRADFANPFVCGMPPGGGI